MPCSARHLCTGSSASFGYFSMSSVKGRGGSYLAVLPNTWSMALTRSASVFMAWMGTNSRYILAMTAREASKFNDHWQNQVVGGGSSTQGVGKQTINIFIGNEKLGKYVVDAVNKEVNA